MTTPLTIECTVHFRRRGRGSRKVLQAGKEPQRSLSPASRVPRVARLMALDDSIRAIDPRWLNCRLQGVG